MLLIKRTLGIIPLLFFLSTIFLLLCLFFFYSCILIEALMMTRYAVSNDGGRTFTKPNYPNNAIITDDRPYPGYHLTLFLPTSFIIVILFLCFLFCISAWSGVGDQGGAYWKGYFYIWYSNADKQSVGVARSSSGLPGTWYKYYQGFFSSPGIQQN